MIPVISEKNAVKCTNTWVSEASQLGIPPGHVWPKALRTTLGNGTDFVLIFQAEHYAEYIQNPGELRLDVLND